MSDQIETQMSALARKFLEENTMRSIFGIPEEALDAVMATAYQLYQAGRYPEVEVLCRGLIAADHKYWWSYSLYASTLRRLGRLREAVQQLDRGLFHEPDEPKLLLMRSELRAAIANEDNLPQTDNDTHAAA
jgi:predicted Zn-dependent protease